MLNMLYGRNRRSWFKGAIMPLLGVIYLLFILPVVVSAQAAPKTGDAALGTIPYDKYDTPEYCGTSCHTDFYQQWRQAMMS